MVGSTISANTPTTGLRNHVAPDRHVDRLHEFWEEITAPVAGFDADVSEGIQCLLR